MRNMIFLAALLSVFTSCKKETIHVNLLAGKWNMIQTELYEHNHLSALSEQEEINTVYYFGSCETSSSNSCDMYIEEDGEQESYLYTYDSVSGNLLLGTTSVFRVAEIDENTLVLDRSYEQYRSVYRFVRAN